MARRLCTCYECPNLGERWVDIQLEPHPWILCSKHYWRWLRHGHLGPKLRDLNGEELARLYEAGASARELARTLGVSHQKVSRHIQKAGVTPVPGFARRPLDGKAICQVIRDRKAKSRPCEPYSSSPVP